MTKLYVVATPIGNLGDITQRAITTLKEVDLIAAEDTRQSKKLLQHYGIGTPLISIHAHNEQAQSAKIIEFLERNQNVAYITDAGTPLISDPGAVLVRNVRAAGFSVVPIPGACAAIAALSVSGFTEPHFYFEGFLPHKSSSRKQRLEELKSYTWTLVFYESPHRILAMLEDVQTILGNRNVIIARELTKKFETILEGELKSLISQLEQHTEQQRGEFVVLVSGAAMIKEVDHHEIIRILTLLMQEMPLKKAVELTSKIVGVAKNQVYQIALSLK